ncbi:autotransporter outer membrane beta-barrel domain-containing protein [Konateibacter massiliensis]|uniref:hypothetical protein n=1 Tax=Konateibacter massiliensis TaxID=2002841 RepID=UPI000C14AC9A|nr:hypothetical protein [Konateibacter massiliensis]
MKKRKNIRTHIFLIIILFAFIVPISVSAQWDKVYGNGTLNVTLLSGTKNGGCYSSDAVVKIRWTNIEDPNDNSGVDDVAFVGGITKSGTDDYYIPVVYPKNLLKTFSGSTTGDGWNVGSGFDCSGDSWEITLGVANIPKETNYIVHGRTVATNERIGDYIGYTGPTADDVDSTKPTVSHTITGTTANSWYASGAKITFTGNDSGSGIDYILVDGKEQANNYVVTPGAGKTTYTYQAVDKMGLTSDVKSVTISVDATAPTISATPSQTKLANGWYKGSTTLKFTASDSQSGLSWLKYNATPITTGASVTVPEGETTYNYSASDSVGNQSSGSISLKIDASAPVVALIKGDTTSWVKQVTLTIKGSDAYSGIATSSLKLEYSADGSTWGSYQTFSSAGTFTTDIERNGYWRVTATDNVGYTAATPALNITNIDSEAPELNYTITGDLKESGWYKGDSLLEFTATDAGGSEIKSITVNGNETLGSKVNVDVTTEGENNYNAYATDYAGNTDAKDVTIKMDKSAPTELSMIPNTTEWTKDPVTITLGAKDTYSGIDTIDLQYTANITQVDWKTYENGVVWKKGEDNKYNWVKVFGIILLGGAEHQEQVNQANYEISVTDNGYYRIVVKDRVGLVTTITDVLYVTNCDPDLPDADTIGIGRNTIQWVNEPTGIEVTSYGSDEISGLSTVAVQEHNAETDRYEDIKVEEYAGETTIEKAMYHTHKNNFYLTKIEDQAGNTLKMKEEEALDVDNVDPAAPDLEIKAISSDEGYISSSKGYIIQALIEDKQSGFAEAILQRLDENGEWQDTNTEYKIIEQEQEDNQETEEDTLLLNKVARKRVIVATVAPISTHSSNQDALKEVEEQSGEEEVREQGQTKVVIAFTVRGNGIYRLKGADLVQNTAYSNDTIEVKNLDGSMPTIRVEGNPTIWQNTDATLTIVATDADTKIATMTLDGMEQEILDSGSGEYSFTFDATKNQEFRITATDEAGNTITEVVKVTKIDKELPVLVATPASDWDSEGYRLLSLQGSDQLSGIDTVTIQIENNETVAGSYPYAKSQKLFASDYHILTNGEYQVTIKDHAGNVTIQSISEAEAKRLKAIEVVVPPNQVKYQRKENFKKKGMVVDAIYNDNSRKENIKDYIILNGTKLPLSQDKIDLSYTENEDTVYTNTPISVYEKETTPATPEEPSNPTEESAVVPHTPKTPISPRPTPVTLTEEERIEESKEEIKEEPAKEVKTIPENTGETLRTDKRFPIGAILGGTGLFLIILFLLLPNVKVYNKNGEGEWRLLGRTRALKVKDKYVVKISKFIYMKAETNSYKLVFSKVFKKFHEECDLLVRIEKRDYEKLLKKDSNIVYVEDED